MNIEVKDIVVVDLAVDYNLSYPYDYEFEKLEDIYFLIELTIGKNNSESGDIFQVIITTPEAIRYRFDKIGDIIPGRKYLIVKNYNWAAIEAAINKIVASCNSTTWEESLVRLNRYFLWEYEDHSFDEEE